jgi:hypothetical protein
VKRLLTAEPTLLTTAVRASLLCAIGFGLSWSTEQLAGFMVAVEAWLALFARAHVTPEVKVQERVDEATVIGEQVGRVKAEDDLRAYARARRAKRN